MARKGRCQSAASELRRRLSIAMSCSSRVDHHPTSYQRPGLDCCSIELFLAAESSLRRPGHSREPRGGRNLAVAAKREGVYHVKYQRLRHHKGGGDKSPSWLGRWNGTPNLFLSSSRGRFGPDKRIRRSRLRSWTSIRHLLDPLHQPSHQHKALRPLLQLLPQAPMPPRSTGGTLSHRRLTSSSPQMRGVHLRSERISSRRQTSKQGRTNRTTPTLERTRTMWS